MHVILLAAGALMAVAGAAMVHYATPVEDVAGTAWVISGIVVLVGGIIVAALAAAVRSLARIAERLEIQPLPLPPTAAVGREDPAPRAVRQPVVAAGPSLLGWLGRSPAPVAASPASTPTMRAAPEIAPPVDLGPLTQIPDAPRAPTPAVPQPARPVPRSAAAPAAPAEPAVYRSGVIDGMAYSLFMDGSIAAELPQGRVKFASVDELQKYLLGKG
jgi:hypothetical protein